MHPLRQVLSRPQFTTRNPHDFYAMLNSPCQENETRMGWACHKPRHPLINRPSEHLGGWATAWSAEEMLLDGQHQRVDIHCPCQNCSLRPPAEKTGRESLLNRTSCPPDDLIGNETELTELLALNLIQGILMTSSPPYTHHQLPTRHPHGFCALLYSPSVDY